MKNNLLVQPTYGIFNVDHTKFIVTSS